eukprot:Gb_20478 [translate_table: standard]
MSTRGSNMQKHIDEVLYLHGLWHQGPPSKRRVVENVSSQTERNKRTKPEAVTSVKKAAKKHGKKRKGKKEAPVSKEPCEPSGGSEGEKEKAAVESHGKQEEEEEACGNENWNGVSGWNEKTSQAMELEWTSTPLKNVEAKVLSEQEEVQVGQVRLQQKAVKLCKEFLNKGEDGSPSEEEEEEDEDEDDDEDEDEEKDENCQTARAPSLAGGVLSKENEAKDFFLKLFEEEQELAKFYEQNCNCGVFECLVCAGIGAKLGKRFPDCVSLIQHATKILNTKRKAAHRGYGKAICKFLGWNADRLPSMAKPNELKPRGCIPPPDEVEAPKEGENDDQEANSCREPAVSDVEGAVSGTKNVENEGHISN